MEDENHVIAGNRLNNCCKLMCNVCCFFFFFKQKTAYEIVSRDWSSDVCSSDLGFPILFSQVYLNFFPFLLIYGGLGLRFWG